MLRQVARQVDEQGFALGGVLEQREHAPAHASVDGVVAAEHHNVAFVDARPHDVEAVVGVGLVARGCRSAVGRGHEDGDGRASFREAVDAAGVGSGVGEESHHGVAHGVGSGFAGHCDGQAVASQEGCGVGEASAGHGAEGRAVGAEHYVEGAFAYADDFFAVVHGCIQRFSPRAATPR